VQIVAVSWGPWDGPGGVWDHGGIWITFYSHPAAVLPPEVFTDGSADLTGLGPLLVPLTDQPGADGAMLGPIGATLPPVLPDNEAGWPFGRLPADHDFPENTTASWALTLRSAWRLMQQPLAARDTEHADRAARHRLARAGLPDAGVRLIRVRPAGPGPRTGSAGPTSPDPMTSPSAAPSECRSGTGSPPGHQKGRGADARVVETKPADHMTGGNARICR
jgi:hypothetical protein